MALIPGSRILKKLILTTLSIVIALFATAKASAATSATANASASIVSSIAITKQPRRNAQDGEIPRGPH